MFWFFYFFQGPFSKETIWWIHLYDPFPGGLVTTYVSTGWDYVPQATWKKRDTVNMVLVNTLVFGISLKTWFSNPSTNYSFQGRNINMSLIWMVSRHLQPFFWPLSISLTTDRAHAELPHWTYMYTAAYIWSVLGILLFHQPDQRLWETGSKQHPECGVCIE